MTRIYSNLSNHSIRTWLETLADKNFEPQKYKETMTAIGVSLGESILATIASNSTVYLASTVEDADFLAKGMLKSLENRVSYLAFACFWNQLFSPFELEYLKIAPILRKYQEPIQPKVDYLIVVQSLIFSTCVVRTNLINLIQKIEPKKIFIAALVIYDGAEEKLKNEFEEHIHNKFKFFNFAKDSTRTSDGEVIPGIGGNIYLRLGFDNQDKKNEYIPEIVKQRRSQFLRRDNLLMPKV